MTKYLPRVVDAELAERLSATGAVVVEGPKACGKTATAETVAASAVYLDVDATAREMVDVDPATVLEGDTPRLVDEWQTKPAVWNHVRRAVDRRGDSPPARCRWPACWRENRNGRRRPA